jgi:superfamily I DNA and/or RNA helicase
MENVSNSVNYVEPGGNSKVNSHNIRFGIKSMLSLRKNVARATADGVGVICPYMKPVAEWEAAIRRHTDLEGVRVVTVNSFQGSEAELIFWDMTVSAMAGGFFSWLVDAKRVCVSLTKHICAFIIIGDIAVANTIVSKGLFTTKFKEDGGKASGYDRRDKVEVKEVHVQILRDIFVCLGARGRVVHNNANRVTP